jgi:hypothetical protein
MSAVPEHEMAAQSAEPAEAPPRTPSVDFAMSPAEVRRRRMLAVFLAVASGGLLAVAWGLKPAAAGFGTHEALGLPPCSWPARFGLPCPSCGMTTAFAYAAKGDLLASFAAQPMGCILALLTGMTLVGSLWTLATGRTLWPAYGTMWNARGLWFLGLVALLAWGYKTALMRGWME